MKYEARVQNGLIVFKTDQVETIFFDQMEGRPIIIQPDDATTAEMRRFFEGAVVPYVFYQHPHAGWDTFKDCREALKLEFNTGFTRNIYGDVVSIPLSTVMSKGKFNRMLKNVENWCDESGYVYPSSQQYDEWLKLNPPKNAIFPPLVKLVINYYKQKGMKIPNELKKQIDSESDFLFDQL